MMRLRDKVAIVTGAAVGIGQEVAFAMAREGAKVVIADIQEEKGRQTAEEAGGIFIRCDVADEMQVIQLMEQTMHLYGKLDILYNNAAVALGGSVTEMTEAQWQKVMNVNLGSVFRCCKHAIPLMKRSGGGAIVSTASVQAHVGYEGWAAYAAAKGGIIAMTKQMAVEYAPYHIRVNCLSPATINTPMLAQVIKESPNPHLLQTWEAMHPIGRIGEPGEVAKAAVFLASDDSSFITGVDLLVDGALTIKP